MDKYMIKNTLRSEPPKHTDCGGIQAKAKRTFGLKFLA